ncbi:MAG: thioesterase family protein [Plesiomonas shigelloides]
MPSPYLSVAQARDFIGQIFMQDMPFNRLLDMQLTQNDADLVEIRVPMRDELIGNPHHRILHGGVTAAILDVVGGILAATSALTQGEQLTEPLLAERLGKVGTIDLRIDYLRPGRGQILIATGHLIRAGNKVAVTRMELHNEHGTHIAFGTGTYLVG